MYKNMPESYLPTPQFLSDLVALHYQEDVYLDPQTSTRWKLEGHELVRDHDGEEEWAEMAEYVDKSYFDVFIDSYRRALDAKNASTTK